MDSYVSFCHDSSPSVTLIFDTQVHGLKQSGVSLSSDMILCVFSVLTFLELCTETVKSKQRKCLCWSVLLHKATGFTLWQFLEYPQLKLSFKCTPHV